MRRTLLLSSLAALALATAAPATQAQQRLGVQRATAAPHTKLLDVKAEVIDLATGRATTYPTTQQIPVTVGDKLVVRLVGSAMVDGRAREVALPADFDVTAGDWRIAVSPRGADAVTVVAQRPNSDDRGRAGSRSQLHFRVRGDYDARHQLLEGFVTFDVASAGQAQPIVTPTSERWRGAERIATSLTALRLDGNRSVDPDLVERIYLSGVSGVSDVASLFAQQAVRENRLRDRAPWEVAALVYNELLGRQGNAADLWRSDTGFRGSLRLLEDRGYPALVAAVVGSQEFRNGFQLDSFGQLALPPAERDAIVRRRELRDTRPLQ